MLRSAAAKTLKVDSQLVRRYAVPALKSDASEKKGLFAAIFGSSPVPLPPLSLPLSGILIPDEPVYPAAYPPTEVTTLSNGVKIASENTPGSTASVGIFINAGCAQEDASINQGVCQLLERMAFKRTSNRSHLRFTREKEAIGANLMVIGSRETMAYTADCIKSHVPEVVELLSDTVMNPIFDRYIVEKELEQLQNNVTAMMNNPKMINGLVLEMLHQVAFQGGLGNPAFWTGAPLSGEAAENFIATHFTGPNIVLAASGVEHAALVKIAEPMLSLLPATKSEEHLTRYMGGDQRQFSAGENVSIALGWEMTGGWEDIQKATAFAVLSSLMGGGSSFSAGGPGKGMYSRLYRNILNKNAWVKECNFFQCGYNKTGVIGIQGEVPAQHAAELIDIMVKELRSVAAKGSINETELARAKNATISSVQMSLESKGVISEDIGRQLLTYGVRKPPSEFIADISKLTAADISACAAELLKSPLSMCSVGDIHGVPPFQNVQSLLK
eukprot:CAMPEP_0196581206 /NCGR_PEP_ID=MMETSP1081-20130531/32934_1 /TAXON_ID=36882 /ORGANISM="Pyramimonas amylifera, Strain CCMP720" /LENGTH=499 /DNA_ID=CAMNT_0041901343 /DNA_START=52 /DNA_END=1551 /DNA_ORIENTATION=+